MTTLDGKTKTKKWGSVRSQGGSGTPDSDELSLLTLYLSQISRFGLLTADEEVEISQKMVSLKEQMRSSSQPDFREKEKELLALKNRMINANLRLVVSVAKKFQNNGMSLLDLISEGNLGLLNAVERYVHTKGCRFSSYGMYWIRQSISKAIYDKGRMIRIPVHMQPVIKKAYWATQQLIQELGREPTDAELADYLHLSDSYVKELRQISQETVSLDLDLGEDGRTSLSELIPDDRCSSPEDAALLVGYQDNLAEFLQKLSEREAQVLHLRFGLNNKKPLTLQQTGDSLGITRERVRQIQTGIINKLRETRVFREWADQA